MDCLRPIEATRPTGNGAAPRPPAIQGTAPSVQRPPGTTGTTGAQRREIIWSSNETESSDRIALQRAQNTSGETESTFYREGCFFLRVLLSCEIELDLLVSQNPWSEEFRAPVAPVPSFVIGQSTLAACGSGGDAESGSYLR